MIGLKFPELKQLNRIIDSLSDKAEINILDTVKHKNHEFPIHCISIGSTDPDAPVLAFFGGVHGLEKIG